MFSLSKFKPDPLTFLSGAMIVLAFPPWGLWPLIFVAVVPWLLALERAPSRAHAIAQGLWLSFLMTLGGFYWVAYVLHQFGGVPWPIAVTMLLLFGVGCQPQLPLFALSYRRLNRLSVLTALVLAFTYCSIDWIVPKLFVDTLGHALHGSRELRMMAAVGGAISLTFIVLLVNFAIHAVVSARRRGETLVQAGVFAAIAAALVIGAWFHGASARRELLARQDAAPRLEVAAIQPNVGDIEKIAAETGLRGARKRVLDTLIGMSEEALSSTPRPQAIIWPETSYPTTFRTPMYSEEASMDARVEDLVRKSRVPVLFGGYDIQAGKDFNSFFFLSPSQNAENALDVYHKSILLLFGEYIPLSETFTFIGRLFPQVGNFGRGKGPSILPIRTGDPKLGDVPVQPIICYEALFTAFTLQPARDGARMILNITNDSWFGPYGEPTLHLLLTTFRSIETGLAQLRSTNTGISTLILPDGEITQPTTIGKPEILRASVPLMPKSGTLIQRWGDWFGPLAIALALIGWIGVLRRRTDQRTIGTH